METHSLVTSFAGLFQPRGEAPPLIQRIEIPLIQRDYAQGRESPRVRTIRDNFLDALHLALAGGDPVGLDFVYGEVDKGTLEPLDGQQRLTTLFLLHWYVAARTGRVGELHSWAHFSYATRPSARLFCERLTAFAPPTPDLKPSMVITDQPWYLHVWAHDPTIQAMLVMLDAIHAKFGHDDLDAAWHRLVDEHSPAISFHLLPIDDMGSTEDLYIKMNSRGKPLTDFENFKARVEKILDGTERADEFGHKIDGVWADVMWPLRGDDDIVDDEFLRYMRFIIELCEWRQGETATRSLPLVDRAERILVHGAPNGSAELAFLFDAFDAWVDIDDTAAFFNELLIRAGDATEPAGARVALFGVEGSNNINLFDACCRDLDSQRFGNPRKLLLYAVLQHLINHTDEFPRRLRVVRNLVEASENEIRLDRMPRLLVDVERIVVDGDLTQVEAFNQAQLDDEIAKQAFLEKHPELEQVLHQLEDIEILRGSLMAFELEGPTFEQRAQAFQTLFADTGNLHALTGALLTVGDYQRQLGPTMYRFGSPVQPGQWREVLTGPSRANIESTRETLGRLLDLVVDSDLPTHDRLLQIQHEWLQKVEAEHRFDWRYYFVKYDAMREGKSGVYGFAGEQLGFSICMLERLQMNSYYRDPYLLAVARECGIEHRIAGSVPGNTPGAWFTGYATAPRWMTSIASNLKIRCIDEGFAILPPEEPTNQATFEKFCADHSLVQDTDGMYVLGIPGSLNGELRVDVEDRVKLGASVLAALAASGL